MRNGTSSGTRVDRQRAIRELVARMPIGSQGELAEQLGRRGYLVTQATVSRDIAELGLVKIPRGDRHVYVAPEDLAVRPPRSDDKPPPDPRRYPRDGRAERADAARVGDAGDRLDDRPGHR